MAEKSSKKQVSIRRERREAPKIVIATGFKLRQDKPTGLLEICLEGRGQHDQRVLLDCELLKANADLLKKYAADLAIEPDDTAVKDDVPVTVDAEFANVVYFSHMGQRAETIFAVFSIADWIEASRRTETSGPSEAKCFDRVVVTGSLGLQKKLLMELLRFITEVEK